MINLTKGNNSEVIYFTARELASIANPYFLFIFTNNLTGDSVIFNKGANESSNERIDKITIDVDAYFENYDCGMWDYTIRQKSNGSDITVKRYSFRKRTDVFKTSRSICADIIQRTE
jgi:hypothetical protein